MPAHKPSTRAFRYGEDRLTPASALALARGECRGVLSPEARRGIVKSQRAVEAIAVSDAAVYGVNTGFGPLCRSRISLSDTRALQHNLIVSHSAGVGEPVTPSVSRLMLVLKAHALARGYSGSAPETVARLLWHLDHDAIPCVPSQGSVGASGDLAPLAHLSLPLIGRGKIWRNGRPVPAAGVLRRKGVKRLNLGPKEGLALINGTQFIAAHALLVLERLDRCLNAADVAGAMTLDALSGSARPCDERLNALRPFPGAIVVARRLRRLLKGSRILASHSHAGCPLVQDPYSLRCMPQVHGAARDAWAHLNSAVRIEINAVTDNPVILPGGEAVSGGLFHGEPLALPLDYATLASAELGSISDRRTYLLLGGEGDKVPRLLMRKTGLHSGLMILQYVSAALVGENKALCFPASADSVPTALGQEDHVSMGAFAGRKALVVVENLEKILAVELICAAQALDYRRPLVTGAELEAAHAAIRGIVPHAERDREYAGDIARVQDFIASGKLDRVVASEAGLL